jgi:anti-anti-sigma factor
MLVRRMSTYEMELDRIAEAGVVASLTGELDLTNAREVEERLREVAPTDGVLAIDLNRVVFIDSAALHVLFKLARDQGPGRLAIVLDPEAPVSRTLDIVGMRDAVRVVASRDQAAPGPSA